MSIVPELKVLRLKAQHFHVIQNGPVRGQG